MYIKKTNNKTNTKYTNEEKDLQSYLNNTLVFYDKNEISLIK